jgi:hypothetical protein
MALAMSGVAQAKTGVSFDKDPQTVKPGDKVSFSVLAFREPPANGGGGGPEHPVVGAHPLVTFRSESGRVIRVRASATDLNGIGYGSVRFTDKGPWTTEMKAGPLHSGPEMSSPIEIGSALPHPAIPPASTPVHADAPFPWAWLVLLGMLGSVAAAFALRRRGLGGTA